MTIIRADLHMHTSFSPDSEMAPRRLVDRCLDVGLDLIAVTDHNTIEGGVAVRQLASFPVIIGEEIGTAEGEITGLFLHETIPPGLQPLETVKRIKDQGGLVSLPHPFDRFRREVISKTALDQIAKLADIVEVFNSRNNLNSDDLKAAAFAKEHGLLMSGVSDAHTAMELSRTYIEMPEFDGSPQDFKRALSEGTIVGRRMSPLIHLTTTVTRIKKKIRRWW